jgi:hypothetical protein
VEENEMEEIKDGMPDEQQVLELGISANAPPTAPSRC